MNLLESAWDHEDENGVPRRDGAGQADASTGADDIVFIRYIFDISSILDGAICI
jgi:hypothetical protein